MAAESISDDSVSARERRDRLTADGMFWKGSGQKTGKPVGDEFPTVSKRQSARHASFCHTQATLHKSLTRIHLRFLHIFWHVIRSEPHQSFTALQFWPIPEAVVVKTGPACGRDFAKFVTR